MKGLPFSDIFSDGNLYFFVQINSTFVWQEEFYIAVETALPMLRLGSQECLDRRESWEGKGLLVNHGLYLVPTPSENYI